MRRVTLVAVLFTLGLALGPTAAFADLAFGLKGVELFPGVTTKDCAAGTYTTEGIKFAGLAHPYGVWTAKLNAQGELDGSCQPVVCDPGSPVEITGGTFVLKTFRGILVTDIVGLLEFRPGPLLSGICPIAPLLADLDPVFKTGIFSNVIVGEVTTDEPDEGLNHNFLPARVKVDLTLTEGP